MYHSLLAVLPLLASMASETAAHPVIKRYSPVSKSFKREVPQGSAAFVQKSLSIFP
jgi:hypothetical protein